MYRSVEIMETELIEARMCTCIVYLYVCLCPGNQQFSVYRSVEIGVDRVEAHVHVPVRLHCCRVVWQRTHTRHSYWAPGGRRPVSGRRPPPGPLPPPHVPSALCCGGSQLLRHSVSAAMGWTCELGPAYHVHVVRGWPAMMQIMNTITKPRPSIAPALSLYSPQ